MARLTMISRPGAAPGRCLPPPCFPTRRCPPTTESTGAVAPCSPLSRTLIYWIAVLQANMSSPSLKSYPLSSGWISVAQASRRTAETSSRLARGSDTRARSCWSFVRWPATAARDTEPLGCPDAVGHVWIGTEGQVGTGSADDLVLWENGGGSPGREGHGALSTSAVIRGPGRGCVGS